MPKLFFNTEEHGSKAFAGNSSSSELPAKVITRKSCGWRKLPPGGELFILKMNKNTLNLILFGLILFLAWNWYSVLKIERVYLEKLADCRSFITEVNDLWIKLNTNNETLLDVLSEWDQGKISLVQTSALVTLLGIDNNKHQLGYQTAVKSYQINCLRVN